MGIGTGFYAGLRLILDNGLERANQRAKRAMAISSTSFKRGNRAAVGHGPRKQPTPKMIAAKRVEDLRVAARELTPKALRTLEAINDDETAPAAARISAANTILAYGWGRPKETIEARGELTFVEIVRRSLERASQRTTPLLPPPELGEIMTPQKYRAMQAGRVEGDVDRK